jgi:hypothetical protein
MPKILAVVSNFDILAYKITFSNSKFLFIKNYGKVNGGQINHQKLQKIWGEKGQKLR